MSSAARWSRISDNEPNELALACWRMAFFFLRVLWLSFGVFVWVHAGLVDNGVDGCTGRGDSVIDRCGINSCMQFCSESCGV